MVLASRGSGALGVGFLGVAFFFFAVLAIGPVPFR
jgi:hypothetical protein